MKIKETRIAELGGGFLARVLQTRVRELDKNEPVPDGAETVADNTPVYDWRND